MRHSLALPGCWRRWAWRCRSPRGRTGFRAGDRPAGRRPRRERPATARLPASRAEYSTTASATPTAFPRFRTVARIAAAVPTRSRARSPITAELFGERKRPSPTPKKARTRPMTHGGEADPSDDAGEESEHPAPLSRREGGDGGGHDRRHQHRRPDTLQDPGRDEKREGRRQSDEQGRDHEGHQAGVQDPFASHDVGESPGHREDRCDRQEVAADHPLERIEADVELACHGGQRHGHGGRVDVRHEGARRDGGEDQPAPDPPCPVRVDGSAHGRGRREGAVSHARPAGTTRWGSRCRCSRHARVRTPRPPPPRTAHRSRRRC